MSQVETEKMDLITVKPGKKLTDLDYENKGRFYEQIKQAVRYLDAHFDLSSEADDIIEDTIAIMQGSKNPLDENQVAILRAKHFAIIDNHDIDRLFDNLVKQGKA